MKVLSLTEPYATLIKQNVKLVETRSWETDCYEKTINE